LPANSSHRIVRKPTISPGKGAKEFEERIVLGQTWKPGIKALAAQGLCGTDVDHSSPVLADES